MPVPRPLRTLACLLAVLLVVSGCTSARRKVDGDIVHKVEFEGLGPPFVRPFSKAELRAAMAQKESGFGVRTPGLTWAARAVRLDRDMLDDDAYRLETWLAHHGYFDARVEGFHIRRKRPQRFDREGLLKKAGVVVVTAHLTFGEPSLVRELDVAWQDDFADRFWRNTQEGVWSRTSYLQPEDPFNLDYVDYSVADLVQRMQEHGYAYADAEAQIDAYPAEHTVDVVVEATTGPPTTIGEITIEGNDRLDEAQIRDVLKLKPGVKLSQYELREAQQRLIATSVFSFAQVEPDLSDPSRREVPVRVQLKEGHFGRVRSGGGVVYDGTTITPRVRTDLSHYNIDQHLGRLEASVNAGVGVPLQGGFDASRILWGFSVGYTRSRVFKPAGSPKPSKWDFTSELSFQRDLLAGQLLYSRAKVSAGLAHRFTDSVILNFGPEVELTRLGAGSLFSNDEADLTELDKLLVTATYGGNPSSVRNPFLLPTLKARIQIDWRKGEKGSNVALDPRGGYFYQFEVRQAIPLTTDGFRFTDLYGEARFYRSLLSPNKREVPYTLALRLKGRWLPGPANTFQDAIPYNQRGFLGGSQDIRAFRINQVGPYDCVCLAQEEDLVEGPFWPFTRKTGGTRLEPNPTFLPRGGRFAGLISGEVRRRWPSGRGMALFGDVGLLARSKEEFLPTNWPHSLRLGAGIGFRQATPIGPLRVDLAFRPRYPEDGSPQRSADYVEPTDPSDPNYYVGRYYGCDDIPDSRIPTRAVGLTPFGKDQPVIVNLAIAIGEAL